MKEGLRFISRNSSFLFLMGLTFFHSFFGTTYIMLMPIFAVDILEVGADGQGLLLGVGAVGSLVTALWLASRRNDAPRAWAYHSGLRHERRLLGRLRPDFRVHRFFHSCDGVDGDTRGFHHWASPLAPKAPSR